MPTRKPRSTQLKRQSIIDAAIVAFQTYGYDNTSMDRIAEQAGASKRTVYNHFPSKDVLFEAVVDRFLSESTALKQIPYDPHRTLEVQLSAFVDAKLSVLQHPAWVGLLRVGISALFRDPALARRAAEQAEVGARYLALWLRDATDDGRLDVADPELAAQLFWGMVSGALFWPQALEGTMPAHTVASLRQELVATFLARHRRHASRRVDGTVQ